MRGSVAATDADRPTLDSSRSDVRSGSAQVAYDDRRCLILGVIASASLFASSAFGVGSSIALPNWQTAYGLSNFVTGLLPTLMLLAGAAGALFGGILAARFGNLRVHHLAILFVAIGNLVVLFAPNQYTLAVGLMVGGLAGSFDTPVVLAVIAERVPLARRGHVIAISDMAGLFGLIAAEGLAFAATVTGAADVTIVFVFNVVLCFAVWGIRMFSVRYHRLEDSLLEAETRRLHAEAVRAGDDDDAARAAANVAENGANARMRRQQLLPSLLITWGFFLCWQLPANTWGGFLNYFLVSVGGQSNAFATGAAFFANIIGMLMIIFVYRRFIDSRHRYVMIYCGLAVGMISLVAVALAGGQWQIFTVCYFLYCAVNMLHGSPVYKIWCQELFPARFRALGMGVTTFGVQMIIAVFGLLTPTLMHGHLHAMLWFLAGCLCVNAVVAALAIGYIRRHHIPDPAV
ncbi:MULTISPECIES: MFS transporter [Bifidobacterium]|uniref:MFS transporter n=1 Tax=Bifidobacterium TaxID=1678 RepID=UPI001BDBC89B|nr:MULTISPECIES: MFS transporter [Bifidobacterium]MBT1161905.1 MFS transporter [Bifidobacterium sp. SO1]MBW3079388.1 MFS transporter [Bifidobacterium simiiventris]